MTAGSKCTASCTSDSYQLVRGDSSAWKPAPGGATTGSITCTGQRKWYPNPARFSCVEQCSTVSQQAGFCTRPCLRVFIANSLYGSQLGMRFLTPLNADLPMEDMVVLSILSRQTNSLTIQLQSRQHRLVFVQLYNRIFISFLYINKQHMNYILEKAAYH